MARKASGGVPKKNRRARVIIMLTEQLERGTKVVKPGNTKTLPLTDGDIRRINREIIALKSRL